MDPPTEPTQFTLEGNEVVHIANMDTNATAEAHTAAEVAVQEEAALGQVERMHVEESPPQHQHHTQPLAQEMHIDQTHMNAIPDDVHTSIPDLVGHTMPTIEQEENDSTPIHSELVDEPTWHNFFSQFQKHQDTYGTLDVDPQTNPPLYEWVEEQRKMFKLEKEGQKGSISSERMLLLDALGFDWEGNKEPNYGVQAAAVAAAATSTISGSPHDVETFHLRLSQIEEFKSVHGHCNIPESYKENPVLGKWIHQQRMLYRKQSLAQDRVYALAEIGFDFNTSKDRNVLFETRVEQLKAYKLLHDHVNIPRNYPEQGLGEWLWNQKKLYRRWQNGNGGMGASRRKILLDLGVDFSEPAQSERDAKTAASKHMKSPTEIPAHQQNIMDEDDEDDEDNATRSTKWDDKFHELREYKLIQGHTNVPRRSKRNPANDALGEWVHFQRRQYRNLLNGKNSTMTISRKKALEVLDFQWSRTGSAFHQNHMYGNDRTSINFLDKTNAVREAVQIQILKAHEEGKTAPWDDRFAQLTEYVQRFGNADVPVNYAENLSLGSWVYRQRIAHKLWQQEQQEQINSIEETSSKEEQHIDQTSSVLQKSTFPQSSEGDGSDDLNSSESLVQASDIADSHESRKAVHQHNELETVSTLKTDIESSQQLQESAPNVDDEHAHTMETHLLESTQVENPHSNVVQSSDLQYLTKEVQLPTGNSHTEAPQSVIENDFDLAQYQSNNEPAFLEVDRMSRERYDKLVAVGFDFEIKKIPDDFITADGQEPAALILSKTVDEEEKPLVDDNQDILEISLGVEEIEPEENSSSKQEIEINDLEVSEILRGNDDNTAVPVIGESVTLPATMQHDNVDLGLNQNVEGTIGPSETDIEDKIAPPPIDTNGVGKVYDLPIEDIKEESVAKFDVLEQSENVVTIENSVERDIDIVQNHEKAKTEQNGYNVNLDTPQNVDVMEIDHKVDGDQNIEASAAFHAIEDKLGQYNTGHITNQSEDVGTHRVEVESSKENKIVDVRHVQGNEEEQNVSPISAQIALKVKESGMNVLGPAQMEGSADPAQSPTTLNEIQPLDSNKRRVTITVQVEWEERVLELIQYKIRKRNCNVPLKWKPNPGLASWVWRQRDQYRLYRLGLPSILTATRIAKLTELGFEFVVHDQKGNPIYHDENKLELPQKIQEKAPPRKEKTRVAKRKTPKATPKSKFKEGKWLQSLAKVVAYKEQHGNCNVPRKWKKDPVLGEWVHFQRRQYRLKQSNRRNHMTEERIRKLEAIGFEWRRNIQIDHYSRYSEHHQQEEDMNVYMERPEEQHVVRVEVSAPNNEPMILDYDVGFRDDQAQQIADVVEQHVPEGEQLQTQVVDHHIANADMEVKLSHEHHPEVIQDKIGFQTADIDPVPVHTTQPLSVNDSESMLHHPSAVQAYTDEHKCDEIILPEDEEENKENDIISV